MQKIQYQYGTKDGYPTHGFARGQLENGGTLGFITIVVPGQLAEVMLMRQAGELPKVAKCSIGAEDITNALEAARTEDKPIAFRPSATNQVRAGNPLIAAVPAGILGSTGHLVFADRDWSEDPRRLLELGISIPLSAAGELLSAMDLTSYLC